MGQGAYSAWTQRVQAENGGLPITQKDVEKMLFVCQTHGEEQFQRMVREEFGGGGEKSTADSHPRVPETGREVGTLWHYS